ncbi:MAG: hypothetical protein K2X39_08075, partial [Silvanigrellaceae bacterium]|nr:hypothetical protein [Silvanigrellaceae bacterium]
DIFKSEQIGKSKKSVTFSVGIAPISRTLNDKDIQKIYNNVVQGIEQDVQGEFRV